MNYFISGWAGFKETVDVPEEWHFIVPFLDLDEEGILNFFKDKSGNTLIGWSTGGHIILKNLSFFSLKFNKIIIVAGFKKFTDYVHPRIVRRMIDRMKKNPDEVIKDFLLNAGVKAFVPKRIEYEKLVKGLEFLISSEVLDFSSKHTNINLIHGKNDRILPLKAIEDLKAYFPLAKVYVIEGAHWIPFNEIFRVEASEKI